MSLLRTDQQLTKNSYYAATAAREQRFPALRGPLDCDVAVVGGGLAGLSAAIELADRGYSVVVLEAQQVGWGASGRNGGQAIAGLACDQGVIEAQLGREAARRVWAKSADHDVAWPKLSALTTKFFWRGYDLLASREV